MQNDEEMKRSRLRVKSKYVSVVCALCGNSTFVTNIGKVLDLSVCTECFMIFPHVMKWPLWFFKKLIEKKEGDKVAS